ncbi:hypothetical protein [Streptomyces sp. NPDC059909]|uniref:hypothetical protein n=1 Tax=Streptomyces sp. NPDC059909 TaxID=3346998 RepID=UPI00365736CE
MKDDQLDIRTVERHTVPLLAELTETIERLENQLTTLAEQAPVTALKAVAALERLTTHAGRDANHAAEANELSRETVGKALGLSPGKARSRLTRYRLRR